MLLIVDRLWNLMPLLHAQLSVLVAPICTASSTLMAVVGLELTRILLLLLLLLHLHADARTVTAEDASKACTLRRFHGETFTLLR